MRRRCARTARPSCVASTTSTATPAPGRSSTPSPWTAHGAASGPTPTTTRWSRTATSGWASTGPPCQPGSRAASPTRRSTSCSRGCPPTGTGRWWPSTSPPAPAPLWWTLRRPHRPLTYHAAHRMFERVAARAGTDATLHALRHTAAYRMAEDPALPLTDVQLVLGHAQLATTHLYLTPRKEDVVRRLLAHHAEQTRQARQRARPAPAPGYRLETLSVLFGQDML